MGSRISDVTDDLREATLLVHFIAMLELAPRHFFLLPATFTKFFSAASPNVVLVGMTV